MAYAGGMGGPPSLTPLWPRCWSAEPRNSGIGIDGVVGAEPPPFRSVRGRPLSLRCPDCPVGVVPRMSPFLASPGPPSSGGAASSRRLWSGVRDVREQNQRRPDPRREEGGRGDGPEWDPVTRWHCGPHPPDLCPGRPGPGPLLGTAGAKTVLKAMPLSFAVLTDLRGPERQCPTHSGGPSSSVTCQPPSVLVPVQCPPPHTLPPGQASTAPPPPPPRPPQCSTAAGAGPPSICGSPALFTVNPHVSHCPGRAGPPFPPDMFLPQVFCEQQLSQADGRSMAAARCGTVHRCQRGTQLGRSRATGGCSFCFRGGKSADSIRRGCPFTFIYR